jgi:uncharacterized protein (TIGR02301 family)
LPGTTALRTGAWQRILPAMPARPITHRRSRFLRSAFAGRLSLRALACGVALACALSIGGAGVAQERPDDPPYEQDLMRLSEILGALHYLRPLCGAPDGTLWRDEMQALIEAEVQDEGRRRRFVERFNQGYRGYSSVYRRCTQAAQTALERYIEEGSALVRNVTTRYNR